MKKLISLFVFVPFLFVGCATLENDVTTLESDIQADAPIILKDISGFWTALNAVNSVVGQAVTGPQLTAVIEGFGVSPTTATTVVKDIGVGESQVTLTANTAIALSNALSAVIPPAK